MDGRGRRCRQGLCEGNAREGLSQRPRDGRRLTPRISPSPARVAGKGGCHGASALSFFARRPVCAGATEELNVAFRKQGLRSDENTSELQSLMTISYDVFCLKKKYNIL